MTLHVCGGMPACAMTASIAVKIAEITESNVLDQSKKERETRCFDVQILLKDSALRELIVWWNGFSRNRVAGGEYESRYDVQCGAGAYRRSF